MSWSIPLDRLAKKAGANIELVARKSTADLFAAVVRRSPVDTGRFRANWNVSYGAADYTTSDSTDQVRGTTQALKALTLPIGGVVFLSNGLVYSRRLEYGYSQQAPAGMVRISAAEFSSYVFDAAST